MSRAWAVPIVVRAALGVSGAFLVAASTLPTDWRTISIGTPAYAGVARVGGNVWDISAPLATGIVVVALALVIAHGVDAVRGSTSQATPLITALLVGFVLATALAMQTHNARSADVLAGLGIMAVGSAAVPRRAERGGRTAAPPGTPGPG